MNENTDPDPHTPRLAAGLLLLFAAVLTLAWLAALAWGARELLHGL